VALVGALNIVCLAYALWSFVDSLSVLMDPNPAERYKEVILAVQFDLWVGGVLLLLAMTVALLKGSRLRVSDRLLLLVPPAAIVVLGLLLEFWPRAGRY